MRRAYTLSELLVAVGLLSVFLVFASRVVAKPRYVISKHVTAWKELTALKNAIAIYHADTGHYPRPTGYDRTAHLSVALRDASPWLYAALRNPPELGGGPNAPYLPWTRVGILNDRRSLLGSEMGSDGRPTARPVVGRLRPGEHGPESHQPLVFLDPWGNPYHYREWASLPVALKASPAIRRSGVFDYGDPEGFRSGVILDRPHIDSFVDLWSRGRNGVNEYGARFGDDENGQDWHAVDLRRRDP